MTVFSVSAQVSYSDTGWTLWTGVGPWGGALHNASTAGATAAITMTGAEAFVVHKIGNDCGIMQVVIDNQTAAMKEIDTYSPTVLWNKKTVIASNLSQGPHTVTVTVTGRKNAASSNALVNIIDRWTPAIGQWSCEKAWAWYKSYPWIVGWNYMPGACVNATEWWQDESHVGDSGVERELALGEQLGYNSIITYLQYIVWRKDSVYLKNRYSRFLTLAAKHHFLVVPVLFDDINFALPNPFLGDQGEPVPGQIMSQWTPSPGPVIATDTTQWPHLKSFVQDMISAYGQDGRILMWDLYNEPCPGGDTADFALVEKVFAWAREVKPSQPLICSQWRDCESVWPYDLADITSMHIYSNSGGLQAWINCLNPTGRPLVCTEWMARPKGSKIEIDLPLFKRNGVWNYSWGLINGRMQCQYPWNNPISGGVNALGWFQDILYNNGAPYRAYEVDAIRKNFARKTIPWVAGSIDGSIVQKTGCTDPRYSEYDSAATVPGACAALLPALAIPGCLDSMSANYNPLATQNDSAMCSAVMRVVTGASATKPLESPFHCIGCNRIKISQPGLITVEIFNAKGALIAAASGIGPCIISLDKFFKNGIFFLRLLCGGRSTPAQAVMHVHD